MTAASGAAANSADAPAPAFLDRKAVFQEFAVFVDAQQPLHVRIAAGMTVMNQLCLPGLTTRPDDTLDLLCVGRNLASLLQTTASAVAACAPPPAGSRDAAAAVQGLVKLRAGLACMCGMLLRRITITRTGALEVCRLGAHHVLDLVRLLLLVEGEAAVAEYDVAPAESKRLPVIRLLYGLLLHCKWDSLLHVFVPHGLLDVQLALVSDTSDDRAMAYTSEEQSEALWGVSIVMETAFLRRDTAEAQALIARLRNMPFLPRYLEALTRSDALYRELDEVVLTTAFRPVSCPVLLWCGGWHQMQETGVAARWLALLRLMATRTYENTDLTTALTNKAMLNRFTRCAAGSSESAEKFESAAGAELVQSNRKKQHKAESGVTRCCSHCLRVAAEGQLVTCGRCKITRYCDAQCQRRDWRTHKLICTKVDKPNPA